MKKNKFNDRITNVIKAPIKQQFLNASVEMYTQLFPWKCT